MKLNFKDLEDDGLQKRSSIFKQLILNIIVPVVTALLVLGVLNYQHTKSIMLEANSTKNQLITDEIKNILTFQDLSMELIEASMDQTMKEYSISMVRKYFASTDSIESINLMQIQKELGMNPMIFDIYVINSNGIVVNTTFKKDLNLNFFEFGENHKKYLQGIMAGDDFVSERFSIEMKTKKLKKYSYQPTKDHKYIIEIGAYSLKATEIVESFKSHLNDISEKYESILAVDMFVGEDNPITFNKAATIDEETKKILQKTFKEKSRLEVELVDDKNRNLHYDYIYMDRKNTDLYKGAVIRIVSDRSKEAKLFFNELVKLLLVFGITLVAVIYLIYKKTRVITNPIKKLVEKVNRITDGNFNERAVVEGSNEIANLSEKFNMMVERLEEYYTELENKVKERTAEILKQKDEIEEQKKHIMDSIHYARRIQNAILPANEYVAQVLPESFILYKPKDIVSGDFYWVKKIQEKVFVAAVDCTGHGVPGAFMSIVGHNQLNHAVNVKKARKPSDILNYLNKGVTNALNQRASTTNVKDGMDIAICTFDTTTNMIEFAGAFNPIYYIHNNELITISGDKRPIGAFIGEETPEFTNHERQLEKGDVVYIFSDGYADQFGGPRGKKFMYKKFKDYLLEIHHLPMNEQKAALDKTFEEWRGDMEQVDDILVIGVKIT